VPVLGDSVFDMTEEGVRGLAAELPAGSHERLSLAHVRGAVEATTELLREAPGALWQAGGADLAALLREVDRLAALADGVRVAIAAEAHQRGEVAASQCATTRAWVGEHPP